jgi:uncharacterized protein (DUF1330 family)
MSAIDETDLPERPNPDGLAAFAQRAGKQGDGPVTMLNLLAFKPDGGQERYAEYGAAVAPLLERVGGRVVYGGQAAPALLGDGRWDLVALVEYPSRQAFLDMVSSPEYQAIAHLRSEALTAGELHPLDTLVASLDR